MLSRINRRGFLGSLAIGMGGTALAPLLAACGKSAPKATPAGPTTEDVPAKPPTAAKLEVPLTRPDDWDAIAFNKARGNAGMIPDTYLGSINGADGPAKHLGKHLPYIPDFTEGVPAGSLALMWGDSGEGYAAHPNAPRNDSNNNEGHWYNWVRVRKAVAGEAEEAESKFSNWPAVEDGDSGAYATYGGGDITADGGKKTIYIVKLPADVALGDTVRIWAHCLTHGEYVDFITL